MLAGMQPTSPVEHGRPTSGRTGGFALPWALAALLLLLLLAAAGFLVATLELRISRTYRASVETFYAAQAALEDYLGTLDPRFSDADAPPDTVVYSFPRVGVTVSTRPLLRLAGGERMLQALSQAIHTEGDGKGARRTVGLVFQVAGTPRPPAALTAASGLRGAEAARGRIDGADAASPPCSPPSSPVLAGIAAPGTQPVSADLVVEGEPAYLSVYETDLRATLGRTWAVLLSLFGPEAVHTVPPDPWPSSHPGEWAVVRIDTASYTLSRVHTGHGVILASHDLALEDGFEWAGLLLVGGSVRIAGGVRIEGGAMAGLNRLAGGDPAPVDLTGADVAVRYHSCHLAGAAEALRSPPAAIPGSWFESMHRP